MSFVTICVCTYFPLDFEGGTWDLIVLIPNDCLCICLIHVFWLFLRKYGKDLVNISVVEYLKKIHIVFTF